MSKRTIVNLLLLAVVGVLVLLVVYEPGIEPQAKPTLSQLDTATVTKITIERTGQPAVSLEKINDNWTMQAPYKIAANKIKVESLLALPGQETFAHYALQGLDVKTYGLDIPRASITYNDKARFDFGGTEPLNNRRYVRYHDMLYVINDHFYYQLMSPVTGFINHKLLPDSDNITKLVLPDFSLTLKDAQWELSPKQDGVSNDRANELIENWRLSHAMQISAYEGNADAKQARVFLDNSETPLLFDIRIEADNVILGRADLGLQYQLVKDKGLELLRLPAKLDVPAVDNTVAEPSDTINNTK